MKFSANGIEHFYEVNGPEDGKPVVFIHAFPFTSEMWLPQVAALRGKYKVITYDLRGFGKTQPGDGNAMVDHYVDDLIALMDHIKLTKATICGLSMGGYVALRLHEKFPERVGALILSDTKSAADTNEAKAKRAEQIKAIRKDGPGLFADGFLKGATVAGKTGSNAGLTDSLKKIILSSDPKAFTSALVALAARTDTTASLANVKVPTLILVGKEDGVTPPADAEALNKAIKGSQLKVLDGAGHISNLEAMREFNAAVESFVGTV